MTTDNTPFATVLRTFLELEGKNTHLPRSLVPGGGKFKDNIKISGAGGQPNEEFTKWQFITALTQSGLYAKDYIGCELEFPKGNKNSAPIRMDAAIFDDTTWIDHYNAFL